MQLVDCASARGGAPRPLIRASAVQMTASFFTGRHSRRVECCGWLAKRVTGGSRSACASTLADQERDLHDHLELGDLIVLDHTLELLDPHRLNVADRLGCALDRLPDRIREALWGSARQFDELHNRHRSLP